MTKSGNSTGLRAQWLGTAGHSLNRRPRRSKGSGCLGYGPTTASRVQVPPINIQIFSTTSRGVIQLHNDFGPGYDHLLYRIVDAKRIRHFRLSVRQLLTTDDQTWMGKDLKKRPGV
jgi:hypothetical protein